MMKNKRCR